MKILNNIEVEILKLRRTPILLFHFITPVLVGAIMMFYFITYKNNDILQRLELIIALVCCGLPVIITSLCCMSVLQEAEANFQILLIGSSNKIKSISAKIITFLIMNFISFMIFMLMLIVASYFTQELSLQFLKILSMSIIVIIFSSIFTYIFHFYICLRFGMGLTITFSIIETLVIILFSNFSVNEINLRWEAIPFAWTINYSRSIIYSLENIYYGYLIVFTTISIIFFLLWFYFWEGKK